MNYHHNDGQKWMTDDWGYWDENLHQIHKNGGQKGMTIFEKSISNPCYCNLFRSSQNNILCRLVKSYDFVISMIIWRHCYRMTCSETLNVPSNAYISRLLNDNILIVIGKFSSIRVTTKVLGHATYSAPQTAQDVGITFVCPRKAG